MAILRAHWTQKLIVAATALTLVFSQTAPALDHELGVVFGGRDDVRAMVNFRLPLGAPQADIDQAPSLGFTVRRQFHFNDPLYETMSGSYRTSQRLTVNALDLRFGTNGKLRGFEVGGFNAFQAKTRLNAADNGNGGTPTWVWLALGGVALVVVVVALAASQDPKCTSGGVEVPCGRPGSFF